MFDIDLAKFFERAEVAVSQQLAVADRAYRRAPGSSNEYYLKEWQRWQFALELTQLLRGCLRTPTR